MPEPYRPAEDTFFLLEEVEKESLKGKRALEIGCGTCYIAAALAGAGAGLVVGCDIEPAPEHGGAEAVRCDARALPFRDGSFDLVVFNPPYLPSEGIRDITVDGGRGGAEVPLMFLSAALRAVKRGGAVYFVVSSLTDTGSIEGFLKGSGSFYSKRERRLFFESLYVYRVNA